MPPNDVARWRAKRRRERLTTAWIVAALVIGLAAIATTIIGQVRDDRADDRRDEQASLTDLARQYDICSQREDAVVAANGNAVIVRRRERQLANRTDELASITTDRAEAQIYRDIAEVRRRRAREIRTQPQPNCDRLYPTGARESRRRGGVLPPGSTTTPRPAPTAP
jgi:hypothetical protein